MSERLSSVFLLLGGTLVILALWAISVMIVRWDTRRRRLNDLEQRAWMAVAIILPLFGFALYLFMRLVRGTLVAPPDRNAVSDESRLTSIKPRPGASGVRGWSQPVNRQAPMPEAAWSEPARPARGGMPAQPAGNRTAATMPGPYRPAPSVGYAFVVMQGAQGGQQFPLNHLPLTIGRGPNAGLALDGDLNVSRRHAEVYEWNGSLRIRDLLSTHGTLVNGAPISDQALVPGDRVQVGGTVLLLRETR